jgi:hypothetical protein
MSERDLIDLERRLNDAIDALNEERAPTLDEVDDEADLLDTLRVLRRLREPAEPDAGFAERLIERSLEGMSPARLLSFPNGISAELPAKTSAPTRPTTRRHRLILSQIAAILRVVGVCVLAGMLAGAIVGGLGGRVAMRVSGYLYQQEHPGASVVTDSSGQRVGQISLDGTVFLILQSIVSGAVIGLLLLLVGPWLPRSGWRRAGGFGLLLLAAVGSMVINPGSQDLRSLGSPLLNVAMFATLIFLAGMLATPIVSWLDHAVAASSRSSTRIGALALGAVAAFFGGVALFAVLLLIVVNSVAVPIRAISDPGIVSTVVAPLVLLVVIAFPLTRVAVAFPDRLAVLDGLRSPFAQRLVVWAIWLATIGGLVILLINSIRIVTA